MVSCWTLRHNEKRPVGHRNHFRRSQHNAHWPVASSCCLGFLNAAQNHSFAHALHSIRVGVRLLPRALQFETLTLSVVNQPLPPPPPPRACVLHTSAGKPLTKRSNVAIRLANVNANASAGAMEVASGNVNHGTLHKANLCNHFRVADGDRQNRPLLRA